jgi:hypothetical protein
MQRMLWLSWGNKSRHIVIGRILNLSTQDFAMLISNNEYVFRLKSEDPRKSRVELISTSLRNFRAARIDVMSDGSVKLDRIGEVEDFRRNVRNPMQRMLWLSWGNKSRHIVIGRILSLSTYDFAMFIPYNEHVLYSMHFHHPRDRTM